MNLCGGSSKILKRGAIYIHMDDIGSSSIHKNARFARKVGFIGELEEGTMHPLKDEL